MDGCASQLAEHAGAERQQREFGHLERLQAERDADDGDAVDNARDEVARRHGQAGAEQPDDAGDERGRAAAVFDGFAKGRERERGHFEGLAPQRNPDDGDAEDASYEEPVNGGEDAAEEHPDDVAEKSHGSSGSVAFTHHPLYALDHRRLLTTDLR